MKETLQVIDDRAIAELTTLDGEEFIEEAYRLLLGRDADPVGRYYYLERLRIGKSKKHIILQMLKSTEAVMRHQNSPTQSTFIGIGGNKLESFFQFGKVWSLFRKSQTQRLRDAALHQHISALLESQTRISQALENIQAELAASSTNLQAKPDTEPMSRQARAIYLQLIVSKQDQ